MKRTLQFMHQRAKSLKNMLFHTQQRNKGSAVQSEMSICWRFYPRTKFRSEEILHVFCFFLNRRAGVKRPVNAKVDLRSAAQEKTRRKNRL